MAGGGTLTNRTLLNFPGTTLLWYTQRMRAYNSGANELQYLLCCYSCSNATTLICILSREWPAYLIVFPTFIFCVGLVAWALS